MLRHLQRPTTRGEGWTLAILGLFLYYQETGVIALSSGDVAQQLVQRGFGVSVKHPRIILEKQRIFDT